MKLMLLGRTKYCLTSIIYYNYKMKTTMALLSFLLLVFSTNPLLASAQSNPVLDAAGEELQTGVKYYILPVIRGNGGGLTLSNANRNGNNCPRDLVQMLNDGNGLPLTFTPMNPNEVVVREHTDLNIEFSASITCGQSLVWSLGDFDKSVNRTFVTTYGVKGNPGRETLGNWFSIENYEDGYKLVHCPGVCDICRVICGDLGIFPENGTRRLANFSEPFKVMFKKV